MTTKNTEINENIEEAEKAEQAEVIEASEVEAKVYAAKVAARRISPDFWDF